MKIDFGIHISIPEFGDDFYQINIDTDLISKMKNSQPKYTDKLSIEDRGCSDLGAISKHRTSAF